MSEEEAEHLIGTARAAATVLREIERALQEAGLPQHALARHTRIALASAADRAAGTRKPGAPRRTGEWHPGRK